MQIEAALSAFRKGEFEMDAARIELVQRSGKDPRSYSGPGYVKQEPDGRMLVRCFAHATILDGLATFSGGPASGELYGEEQHFDCRITDHNAQVWETDPVLIHTNYSVPMEAASINVPLPRLVRRLASRASGWSLRLEFRDQEKDDWRALKGTHSLELTRRKLSTTLVIGEKDGIVSVEASSETELPANMENCLIQSLNFVLGQELRAAVSDAGTPTGRGVTLHAMRRPRGPHPALPPLPTTRPDPRRDVMRLLQHYLEYILGDAPTEDELVHPLSAHVSQARQVSGNSFDSWAVGLSVAVEGVAKLVPYTPPVSDTDFAALSKKVRQFLASVPYSETMIARVIGLLQGMGSISAKDRMHSLVPSGAVQKGDIDAWSKIRNSMVHTRQVMAADLVDAKLQRQLDLLFKVHRLLHSMIFHLVAYEGPFIDYGTRNFPIASYPFEPADDQPPASDAASS